MRLNRHILLVLAALLALSTGIAPGRAADDPAIVPVNKLIAKVEEIGKANLGDLKSRAEALGPTLIEVFDTAAMLPVAYGPKWKSLKPEQQSALAEGFNTYFTTLYANRLSQALGGKFDVKPESEARSGNQIVHTKVTTKDGDDEVDYVVNASNRIQDVLLNGNVSEVTAMRGSFADSVKKGPEALIAFMRQRVDGMLAAKRAP